MSERYAYCHHIFFLRNDYLDLRYFERKYIYFPPFPNKWLVDLVILSFLSRNVSKALRKGNVIVSLALKEALRLGFRSALGLH